jgi:hypothetical protein
MGYCVGAYWQGATLLGPDTRTLPPILAEPRSGPRSPVRFVAARFQIFILPFARFFLETNFTFSPFKNFRFPILQDSQNAKMIARRSSRKRSGENKVSAPLASPRLMAATSAACRPVTAAD